MPWKLIILTIAFADAGLGAPTTTATDFIEQVDCVRAERDMNGKTITKEMNGRKVSVETRARCYPNGVTVSVLDEVQRPGYRRGASIPPEVVDIAPPFPGGTLPRPIDRPMLNAPIEPHAGPEPWPQ